MKKDDDILNDYIELEYTYPHKCSLNSEDMKHIKNTLAFQRYLCHTRIKILFKSITDVFKWR